MCWLTDGIGMSSFLVMVSLGTRVFFFPKRSFVLIFPKKSYASFSSICGWNNGPAMRVESWSSLQWRNFWSKWRMGCWFDPHRNMFSEGFNFYDFFVNKRIFHSQIDLFAIFNQKNFGYYQRFIFVFFSFWNCEKQQLKTVCNFHQFLKSCWSIWHRDFKGMHKQFGTPTECGFEPKIKRSTWPHT